MIESNATGTLRMEILEENQKILEQRQELSNEVNERISNQIEISSLAVSAISLFATIGGIFLAIFINKSYEKITKIKREVEETKAYVDAHNEELYLKLRRNDTLNILNRLSVVPEDIHNVSELLLSRDLEGSDFSQLKIAYLSDELSLNDRMEYITVFMQHFPYESLSDEDLRTEAIRSLSYLDSMFRRDVQNLFDGVIKFLDEVGMESEVGKVVVSGLINGLFISKHNSMISLFREGCKSKAIDVPKILVSVSEGRDEKFIEWLSS
ncbi:MAG: hypothetical protein RL538_802 [Candidatus Parcubacteria bacterium]|jgi:hypothetical protein